MGAAVPPLMVLLKRPNLRFAASAAIFALCQSSEAYQQRTIL
jgi:hypothetical protein